ncbi:hypothetical protein PanWU01x14_288750, partial [Parasponia andersonii]
LLLVVWTEQIKVTNLGKIMPKKRREQLLCELFEQQNMAIKSLFLYYISISKMKLEEQYTILEQKIEIHKACEKKGQQEDFKYFDHKAKILSFKNIAFHSTILSIVHYCFDSGTSPFSASPSPDKSSKDFPLDSGTKNVKSTPKKFTTPRIISVFLTPIPCSAYWNPKAPMMAPAFPAAADMP